MRYKKLITFAAFISITAIASAFMLTHMATQPVQAFNPQPDPPGFGLVGITDGQTIRVNVVNTATPPDPDASANPARVVIIFRDANGVPMTNANGAVIRRVAQLKGGESTFLQINADSFARESNGRIQLRPDVRIQQSDSVNGIPPDPVIPTTEIVNNANGRTQFMLNFLPAVQRTATAQ